jgi:hypothetical protein
MKKSYLIIGVIIVLVILGVGFHFLKTPAKTPSANVQSSAQTSPVGLWDVEKMYADNGTDFVETPIDFSVYGGHIYMEYTKDGKWCSQWEGYLAGEEPSKNCSNYDTYTISNDIITQNQVGLTGPQTRYKWKVDNGQLELTAEVLDESTNTWTPILRYTLNPASR